MGGRGGAKRVLATESPRHGLKMIAKDWYHVSTGHSLLVIAGVLALSIGASLAARKRA